MKTTPSPWDRESWLTIFETAVAKPGDQQDADWNWLLVELGLFLEDYPSLILTLEEGRWRKAKNPRAYVKTVARRLAARQRAAERSKIPEFVPQSKIRGVSSEELLGYLAFVSETDGAVRGKDGTWRLGGENELFREGYDEDSSSLRERLWNKLPLGLIKHAPGVDPNDFDPDSLPGLANVDIEKWAELAGLDDGEKRVLRYHAVGVSRDRALVVQPDEVSRRALQAAWRRFDRTGRRRLLEVAKKLSR